MPIWLPFLAFILGSLLLALAIVACGPADAMGSFVTGFLLLVPGAAAIVISAILAAWPVVRRVVPDEPLSLRIATSGALGMGLQGLLVLAVGLCGWINRGTAIAIVLIPGAIGAIDLLLAHRRAARAAPSPIKDPPTFSRPAWLLLAASPIAAISLCASAMFPGSLWLPDPHPYDVASYHLQIPRQWFDAGKTTPLNENIFSYFPHGAETLDLLAMEIAGDPWVGMYHAQFLSCFQTLLMLAAIWGGVMALAKSAGVDDPHAATLAAALATLAAASVPWIAMLSCVSYVESLMLLHTAAATVWTLLAVLPGPGKLRRAVLAGLLAGLACGTKYTAVPMTLIPLALAAAGAICSSRALRSNFCVKQMLSVPAIILLAGSVIFSPWLIRNLIWTGNPVFPLALHILSAHNLTPAQVERFEIAHEPTGNQASLAGHAEALFDQVIGSWQYAYLLLPLGCAAAFWRLRPPANVFFIITMTSIAVVWLRFTHLESRFFVSMIPTAALAGGLCMSRILSSNRNLALIVTGVTALVFFLGLSNLLSAYVDQAKPRTQESYFFVPPSHSDLLIARNPELDSISKQASDPDFKLALIGDAQAFNYPMPSRNLLYRNVFDVNIPAGVTLTDGWLGQSVDSLRQQGYWVDIDIEELRRLSRTYRNLPPLPDDLSRQTGRVLLPPVKSSESLVK